MVAAVVGTFSDFEQWASAPKSVARIFHVIYFDRRRWISKRPSQIDRTRISQIVAQMHDQDNI
jgi:hypothetical protein